MLVSTARRIVVGRLFSTHGSNNTKTRVGPQYVLRLFHNCRCFPGGKGTFFVHPQTLAVGVADLSFFTRRKTENTIPDWPVCAQNVPNGVAIDVQSTWHDNHNNIVDRRTARARV